MNSNRGFSEAAVRTRVYSAIWQKDFLIIVNKYKE